MPNITIDRAGLSGVGGLRDPSYEKISPDLTVANSLAEQGGIVGKIGQQMFNQGAAAVEQYKKGIDTSYIASQSVNISKNISETVDRLQNDSLANPDGHSKRVIDATKDLYKAALDNAPSVEAQRVLKSQIDQHMLSTYSSAANFEKNTVVTNRLGEYNKQMNILSNSIGGDVSKLDMVIGQNNQLLESLAKLGASPERVNELQKKSTELFSRSLVKQMNPQEALKLIASGALDANLDAGQQEALIQDANGRIKEQLMKADLQQRQAEEDTVNRLKILVSRDQIDYDTLENIRRSGQISDKNFLDISTSFAESQKTKIKRAASNNKISKIIDSGQGLNVNDAEQEKEYDNWYQDVVVPSLSGKSPEEQGIIINNLIVKVGAAPKAYLNDLRGKLNNPDPATKSQAAQSMISLTEANPTMVRQFDNKDYVYAKLISDNSQFMAAPDAIDLANKAVYGTTDEEKNRRLTEFSKMPAVNFRNNENEGKGLTTGGFLGIGGAVDIANALITDVPEKAKEDWQKYYRTNIVEFGMNKEQAIATANKQFDASWGKSTINGVNGRSTYMKAAPELVYGIPGKDNNWIKEQLLEDAKPFIDNELKSGRIVLQGVSKIAEGDIFKFIPPESVQLEVIPSTIPSGQPKYLMYVNLEGNRTLLRDKRGIVQTFQPDKKKVQAQFTEEQQVIETELVRGRVGAQEDWLNLMKQ